MDELMLIETKTYSRLIARIDELTGLVENLKKKLNPVS